MNKKMYTMGAAAIAAATVLGTSLSDANAWTFRTRVRGDFPNFQTWTDSPLTGTGSLSATITLLTNSGSMNVQSNSGFFDSQFQWGCADNLLHAINNNFVFGNSAGDESATCPLFNRPMQGIVGMIDDL